MSDLRLQRSERAVCECGHGVGVHGPSCPCGCESFRAVGPFDPDELVRWAETYGHPEEWAKKAQSLHAQNERLRDEQRALMDRYDVLHRDARELWDALVACAEHAPEHVKILIRAREALDG